MRKQHDVSGIEWTLGEKILDPASVLPLFIQVAYLALGVIAARRIPPGSPLPTESALASRWSIGPGTVRKAYSLLKEQGIIDARPGIGHYVADMPRVRRVKVQPGSLIYARPPTPQELADLTDTAWGSPVIVVEEPGRNPVARDAMSTVIYC
jgi:DNA-binding transcriptional MocR family regulator